MEVLGGQSVRPGHSPMASVLMAVEQLELQARPRCLNLAGKNPNSWPYYSPSHLHFFVTALLLENSLYNMLGPALLWALSSSAASI
jgi:hypothetical protein